MDLLLPLDNLLPDRFKPKLTLKKTRVAKQVKRSLSLIEVSLGKTPFTLTFSFLSEMRDMGWSRLCGGLSS